MAEAKTGTTNQDREGHRSRRVVGWSVLAVFAMFAFGFALVPLYEVFCEITGLNGKTGERYTAEVPLQADITRTVRVQFMTTNNENMPWEFKPVTRELRISPGKQVKVEFLARNPTGQRMIAQAVPSVSPSRGASYFHKTECFCFEQQELEAGGEVRMPLIFLVDPDLPKDVNTLTLSYTIFDVTEMKTKTKS